MEWACNLSAGDVEIGESWALWQASPGDLVGSRPIRKPVSIKDGQHWRNNTQNWLLTSICTSTQEHTQCWEGRERSSQELTGQAQSQNGELPSRF